MNVPAFLDDAEVVKLTGYVKPSKQIARLIEKGIPHEVNAKGYPVVRRDYSEPAVKSLELGPVR